MNTQRIVTPDLVLYPFNEEMLLHASEAEQTWLAPLGLRPSSQWPEPDLVEALPAFVESLRGQGMTGFGLWLIGEPRTASVVGSLGFMGPPDASGAVELGFGVVPAMQGRGFCTQAVSALVDWAWAQPRVALVTAHCEPANGASASVLRKCGFHCLGTADNLLVWEKRRAVQALD